MGVIGLFPFLRRRYPLAFPMEGKEYDHIYTDSNAMLYPLAEVTVDPVELGRLLLEVANEYHTLYKGIVHIYLDGAPHLGKVRHQRLRRFRYPPLSAKMSPDGKMGLWTPAVFTPGTDVMRIIGDYVRGHLHEYPGIATFSSSDEPGEGEHKLVRDAKRMGRDKRIAFVSPDADMLLLGMGMESHNVTVLRHTAEDDGHRYKGSHEMAHVNCPLLRSSILTETGSPSIWNFIISTFIVGNDFIPPVPECNEIFKVLPRVMRKRVRIYDERKKSIRWEGLVDLLKELQGHPIDDRWVGKVSNRPIFNDLYYTKYFPMSVDKDKLVQQWFVTMEWIFQYYKNGMEVASIAWQYGTSVSPSLSTIMSVGVGGVKGLELAVETVPPLLPIQALAAALPPWLGSLLPPDVREKLESYPEYYPFSFKSIGVLDQPIIPVIPYSVVSSL